MRGDHNTGLARLAAGYVIFIMFYQNLKAKALGHKTRAVVGSTEISLSGNLLWWQVNFKIVQAAFLAVAEVSNQLGSPRCVSSWCPGARRRSNWRSNNPSVRCLIGL